jgi:hypothetical protein
MFRGVLLASALIVSTQAQAGYFIERNCSVLSQYTFSDRHDLDNDHIGDQAQAYAIPFTDMMARLFELLSFGEAFGGYCGLHPAADWAFKHFKQ